MRNNIAAEPAAPQSPSTPKAKFRIPNTVTEAGRVGFTAPWAEPPQWDTDRPEALLSAAERLGLDQKAIVTWNKTNAGMGGLDGLGHGAQAMILADDPLGQQLVLA